MSTDHLFRPVSLMNNTINDKFNEWAWEQGCVALLTNN